MYDYDPFGNLVDQSGDAAALAANVYTFVNNDPVNGIDPFELEGLDDIPADGHIRTGRTKTTSFGYRGEVVLFTRDGLPVTETEEYPDGTLVIRGLFGVLSENDFERTSRAWGWEPE